jgi:hypothetical protein
VAYKIPSIKGFPPKKARDSSKLWPRKSHPSRDSHPKRPGTAVSYGLENPIHEGISTEKSLQDDFERVNE